MKQKNMFCFFGSEAPRPGIEPTSPSLEAQLVKNLPVLQETLVRFLNQEDPLEKG